MKMLYGTLFVAAMAGATSLASAQTVAPPNASFADEFAAWQRLTSANPAYRVAAPVLGQPAADPIVHPATMAERKALFQSEESAWQAASRSATAPDEPPVQAATSLRNQPRESLAQRELEFAEQEQTYQQLTSGNAVYRQPTSLVVTVPRAVAGSPAPPAS